jgi:hypothetical protein
MAMAMRWGFEKPHFLFGKKYIFQITISVTMFAYSARTDNFYLNGFTVKINIGYFQIAPAFVTK